MLSIFAGSLLSMVVSTDRAWDVTVLRGAEKFSLRVQEQEPILTAVERAGLFPGSECRRGNCLSCAARVVAGAPFSLRVDGCTALCEEAHGLGFVLLCSSYAVGPGLELALGQEGEAWEVQHSMRWQKDATPVPPLTPETAHFRLPEDAVILLERCSTLECDASDGEEEDRDVSE